MKIIETDFIKNPNLNIFTGGLRTLFLINRAVSNSNKASSRWVKKIIVEDNYTYLQAYEKLKKSFALPTERIYAHLNARKLKGAIREFKRKQIDADYSQNPFEFYKDAKNQFVSAMSIPANKETSFFLLDYDAPDCHNLLQQLKFLHIKDRYLDKDFAPIFKYQTKNGWPVITPPFNPKFLNFKDCELKKDGLVLLAYGEE